MRERYKRSLLFYMVMLSIFGLLITTTIAGNPILKEHEKGFQYTADPAAKVFNGRVYVYCTHDQVDANDYSGLKDYIVLESKDLKHWKNHGVILEPRDYSWASGQMNAPDVAYKNGWYYFYFPFEKTHIGVSKSQIPTGPWTEAVTNKICTIFDPCVFVDDDGQAFIYGNDHKVDIGDPGWHIMGARLKPNMIELDGPWIRLSRETVNEAVSVFKRNDIYYFMARKDLKTVYFMADSPLPTEYAEYKGRLTVDQHDAPAHTSAIEFEGHWYLFYQRGDVNHGTRHRRSVCFDRMEFNTDGTIKQIDYTLEK